MKQDQDKISILSITYLIYGIFMSATSLKLVVMDYMAYRMIFGSGSPVGNQLIASDTIKYVVLPALLFLAFGILHIVVSRKLKAREAHGFCLTAATIGCLAIPFGPVLGVYTIITLRKESIIQIFNGKIQPEIPVKPGPSIPG